MAIPSTNMIKPPIPGGSSSTVGSSAPTAQEPYDIVSTNWFKSLPYGFSFFDIGSKTGDHAKSTIYLPISPSNITVSTSFATNVITTLYGIVEEHSEVRYYDITIQGTTGFAPRFVSAFESGTDLNAFQSNGRSAFSATGINLGGFLPEITNTINQALDAAQDIGNALSGPTNPTGITPEVSGYVAFHNLYRFFLKYKKDAAQVTQAQNAQATNLPISLPVAAVVKRNQHPIQFLNYKDGIKYDCVPLSFTLVRSAESPFLYNYAIKLKAFNLRNVNGSVPEGDQLAKLGLGGLDGQSIFSTMTSIAGTAATVISGLL